MLGSKCLSVFAVLTLCSFAFAADEKQMSDQDFVKDAAIGGMFEVQAGKLATQKGGEQARAFGAQMVADHGMANDELKAIAQKKNITLPTELDAQHKEKLDKLSGLSGAEFDKHYIECMKKDHAEDLEKFKTASTSLQDADLKAFAAKTLQVVERHKQHIDGLASAGSPPNNTATTQNNQQFANQNNGQRFDTASGRFQDNNAQNTQGASVSSQTTTTQQRFDNNQNTQQFSNQNTQQFSTQNNQQFSNQNNNQQFSNQNTQQYSTEQRFSSEPRESVDAQYRSEQSFQEPVYTDSGFTTEYYQGSGRRYYSSRTIQNDCHQFSPSLDSTPSWNQR